MKISLKSIIINPQKSYNKHSTFVNLEKLLKAQQYVIKCLTLKIDFFHIIKYSYAHLGYYLKSDFVHDYIVDLYQESMVKPFRKEDYNGMEKALHLASIFMSVKERFKIKGDFKKAHFIKIDKTLYSDYHIGLEKAVVIGSTFDVIVAFKDKPILLEDFNKFIYSIYKEEPLNLTFYMADTFIKNMPRLTEEEHDVLEHCIYTLNTHMPTLRIIAYKNQEFDPMFNKLTNVFNSIVSFMQQVEIPDIMTTMDSTRQFSSVNPNNFEEYFKALIKGKNIQYQIINRKGDLLALIKSNKASTLYLNCSEKDFIYLKEHGKKK